MSTEIWSPAMDMESTLANSTTVEAANALSVIRRAPLFRPDVVLELGYLARRLYSAKSLLYWDITEEIAIAAADRGKWDILQNAITEISNRFPKSWRLGMLIGRREESKCLWNSAIKIYMGIVDRNPLSRIAYKRQVAVLKSQCKIQEAIALLNYYLTLFSRDLEAWAELCSLCLSRGRLEHAIFAANELILHSPMDYAAHIVVADVYMTIGGDENVFCARKHYATSLLCKKRSNMRALYGMWLAAATLSRSNKWNFSHSAEMMQPHGILPSLNELRAENINILQWSRNAIQCANESPRSFPESSVQSERTLDPCRECGILAVSGLTLDLQK